jgi:hypothetical protein
MKCTACGHHSDAHDPNTGDCVQCGCVHLTLPDRSAREARLRTWIVNAEFFVKNRWIAKEVRVKAMGHGGAVMKGVREAKTLALKPRTRVQQVRLTLIPVPKRSEGQSRTAHRRGGGGGAG